MLRTPSMTTSLLSQRTRRSITSATIIMITRVALPPSASVEISLRALSRLRSVVRSTPVRVTRARRRSATIRASPRKRNLALNTATTATTVAISTRADAISLVLALMRRRSVPRRNVARHCAPSATSNTVVALALRRNATRNTTAVPVLLHMRDPTSASSVLPSVAVSVLSAIVALRRSTMAVATKCY